MSLHRVPAVFFFALFPAFFTYHALITMKAVTPFIPGGGWTFTNALGVAVLGTIVLHTTITSQAVGKWRVHAPVAVLGAWVAVYAVGYALFGSGVQRSPEMFLESAKLLIGWGCLYCIGYLFRPDAAMVRLLLYSLMAMAAITLLMIDPADLLHPGEGGASYHWFANAIVFVAIFALALAPLRVQPAVVAVALCSLFVIGSRAEFYGFAILILGWAMIHVWQRRIDPIVNAMVATLLVSVVAGAALPHLSVENISTPAVSPSAAVRNSALLPLLPSDETSFQRQLEIANLTTSRSWQDRESFLIKGWAGIKSSPLAGDYGGQLRDGGSIGSYIHNGLSAWRQFGLVPFLIYAVLCLAPFCVAGWRVARGETDPLWMLTLYAGGFTLLLVVMAKSVFWALPALAWGLLAQQLTCDQAAS